MIKRKTILIILSVIMCNTAFASDTRVTMRKNDNNTNKGHRTEIPIVDYNDSSVIITNEVYIPNAHVVITDENGKIVADSHISLSAMEQTVSIPQENGEYTIHISYNNESVEGVIEK